MSNYKLFIYFSWNQWIVLQSIPKKKTKKKKSSIAAYALTLCKKCYGPRTYIYEFHNCTFLNTLLSASSVVIVFRRLHTKSNHDIAFFLFLCVPTEAFHTKRAFQKSGLVYTLWTHQRHRDITQWVSKLLYNVLSSFFFFFFGKDVLSSSSSS